MAVEMLRLSNWMSWPAPGGWADQDQRLFEDVMTYLRLEKRLSWEVKHGVVTDFEEQKADMRTLTMGEL